MEEYLIILFRLITIMALLLAVTLVIMGKRPIGELPVFDFLVLVVMGAVVGADIADPDIKHMPTAFAIITLACIQRLVSFFSLRYKGFRRLITFEPTLILYDGKLIRKNIKRIHFNLDEILMMLREEGIFDISRVEYGIIESNGRLSVLKKPHYETVTVRDMNLPYPSSNAALTVILDGKLQRENILRMKMTEDHVLRLLKDQGYAGPQGIFLGTLDFAGHLHISTYGENAVEYFSKQGVSSS